MNDQSKDQASIEYNTNDTKKRKFGDTLNLVWMDTIEHVISELECCLNPLQQDMENRTFVCEASDMLDILQSCSEKIELLIQIEKDADRLRDLIEKKVEKNS